MIVSASHHVILSPPPLRGRLGWGVIEERDDDRALRHTNLASIEFVATPHPSLPLKGGGEEGGATRVFLSATNRTAVEGIRR